MQTAQAHPRINPTTLQVIAWLIVYVLLILYRVQMRTGEVLSGVLSATVYTSFYILTVYANSHYLLPRWFQRGRYAQYALWTGLFLVGSSLVRMEIERQVLFSRYNHAFSREWTPGHFAVVFVTMFLALLFGFLLRIGLDYVDLLKKQEELKRQNLQAELNLLKARVQPHFLFNTLNNLYYLAHSRSERTAEVVARLATIMRYFTEEAPHERVPLRREWQLLHDYIELEQLRLVFPLQLTINQTGLADTVWVPPMLLIPLVENVFKHGVDKSRADNEARITLIVTTDELTFSVTNTAPEGVSGPWRSLANLQKRLSLLFESNYELTTEQAGHYYTAHLRCPVSRTTDPWPTAVTDLTQLERV